MADERQPQRDTSVTETGEEVAFQQISQIFFDGGITRIDRAAILIGLIDQMARTTPTSEEPDFTPDQSEEMIEVIRDILREPRK